MNDYRCTHYCPPFEGVAKNKTALLGEIRKTHPRAQNIYSIVNVRESEAHRGFFQIYNYKCCYCGCSVKILSSNLFEIDHLKPVSNVAEQGENLNAIENLVLACRTCNGGKLAFWVKEMSNAWSPDNGGITQLFFRDDLYNICISTDYQSNEDTKELYKFLKLGAQFRRLDYLLMSMNGYIEELPEGTSKRIALLELYRYLQEKRNFVGI